MTVRCLKSGLAHVARIAVPSICMALLSGCAAALIEGRMVVAVLERDAFITAIERRAILGAAAEAGSIAAERRALLGIAGGAALSAGASELGARFRVGGLGLCFRPLATEMQGRIPIKGLNTNTHYASFEVDHGRAMVYDRKGKVVGTSRFDGEKRILHFIPGEERPWGYSMHDQETNIITHFEHKGPETKKIGYDLLIEEEKLVKHFDSKGVQIGSTLLKPSSSGYIAFVVGAMTAANAKKDDNSKAEQERVERAARSGRLKSIFRPGATLSGRQFQGSSVWTFKITIGKFSSATGEFEGRIDYTNLDSIHSIKGQVVEDTFGYKEIDVVKRGRATPGDSHFFRLLPNGNIEGEWESRPLMYIKARGKVIDTLEAGVQRGKEMISIQ